MIMTCIVPLICIFISNKDKDYMATLAEYLPTLLNNFRPDLVLYDAGVDPHEADDLGKLCLTDQGRLKRSFFIMKKLLF